MIDVLGALADEGAAFELALRRAPASEFGRLTDCPPWTLSELVVRVAASIRIAEFTPAAPDSVLREGADYYCRLEVAVSSFRSLRARLVCHVCAGSDARIVDVYR